MCCVCVVLVHGDFHILHLQAMPVWKACSWDLFLLLKCRAIIMAKIDFRLQNLASLSLLFLFLFCLLSLSLASLLSTLLAISIHATFLAIPYFILFTIRIHDAHTYHEVCILSFTIHTRDTRYIRTRALHFVIHCMTLVHTIAYCQCGAHPN